MAKSAAQSTSKRSRVAASVPSSGVPVLDTDDVLLARLGGVSNGHKPQTDSVGPGASNSLREVQKSSRTQARCLPDVSEGPGLPRRRQQAPLRVADAVVGYQGDAAEDPTPIRLVRRGKELQQGEVFETQSEEIKKEFPAAPIAKAHRARYNWVAETEGGRYTRDPAKMVPSVKSDSMAGRWTCDVCGKMCDLELYVFRAFLRKEHLGPSPGCRTLDPFVAYISARCGRGLLGQLSDYARFKEEVFSLTATDLSLDEVRAQLEESLRNCGREDRQFLFDELERLAGVGPGGARKTLEMESVEKMMPGPASVLLRTAEDAFRAIARVLAPRVGARLLASAAVIQARRDNLNLAPGSYLRIVTDSLDIGGPLPQAPARWSMTEALQCIELVVKAANPCSKESTSDDEEKSPCLRIEFASSWEDRIQTFGPKDALVTIRLGFLQARQALHAFVGPRASKEAASAIHQHLEKVLQDAALPTPTAPSLAPSYGSAPGMLVKPPPNRHIGRAESLGFGWHSADWAQRLKTLLGAEFDFRSRPLRLVTGCSGAEAPHFAMQQLVGHDGFEQLWGSEINENPRRFILKNCQCKHLYEDICFVMDGGGRCARHGGHCAVPEGPVDIFVGGFPCTPYSFCNPKRFKRNCFTEPAAKPFFEMRKFIAERRPRLVILENVRGLLAPNPETEYPPIDFILRGKNPDNKEDCYQGTEPGAEWGLTFIPGYGLRWDVFYSCDWGLPQSRPRVYIVMVREDAGGQAAAERMFEVLSSCMGRLPRGSCNDFLFPNDHPNVQAALKRWASHGAQKGNSRRACTKFTEALFRTKRQELGLSSNDRPYSGARRPGWFPHATEKMVQQLDIIYSIAERQGLDFNFLLADLSQQVSRGAWRDDGNVPTLTTGTSLYSFERHRPLLGMECMWLNGFPIDQIDLGLHQEPERIFLAGNAMSVPVVGAVIFAGLASLNWGEGRTVKLDTDALPEPVAMRPDAQKLIQPSANVVMSRIGHRLLDDDDEAAVDDAAEAVAEATPVKQSENDAQAAWSRRAAVLLALARDYGNEQKPVATAEAPVKTTTATSNTSLVAAVRASTTTPGEVSDDDEAAGDGTSWFVRSARVETKKASEDEIARWLSEAAGLLVGMDRQERGDSAAGLQKFVVKALVALREVPHQRFFALQLASAVKSLWTEIRFAEAKPLFGRFVIEELQQKVKNQKDSAATDSEWLLHSSQLSGPELYQHRAALLTLLTRSRSQMGRLLAPILNSWRRDWASADTELTSTQKAVELVYKSWKANEPPEAWAGLSAVVGLLKVCGELARTCESKNRPKSSQIFRDLFQRLRDEVLPARCGHVLTYRDVMQVRRLIDEMIALKPEETAELQSLLTPLQSFFVVLLCNAPADKDFSMLLPTPEEVMVLAKELARFRSSGAVFAEVAKCADGFLQETSPILAALVHRSEEQLEDSVSNRHRSVVSADKAIAWSELKILKLQETKVSQMCMTSSRSAHLNQALGEWSQSLNHVLKALHSVINTRSDAIKTSGQQVTVRACQEQRRRQDEVAKFLTMEEFIKELQPLEHFIGNQEVRECLFKHVALPNVVELEEALKHLASMKHASEETIRLLARTAQRGYGKNPELVFGWRETISRVGLRFFQHQEGLSETRWAYPTLETLVQPEAQTGFMTPCPSAPRTPPKAPPTEPFSSANFKVPPSRPPMPMSQNPGPLPSEPVTAAQRVPPAKSGAAPSTPPSPRKVPAKALPKPPSEPPKGHLQKKARTNAAAPKSPEMPKGNSSSASQRPRSPKRGPAVPKGKAPPASPRQEEEAKSFRSDLAYLASCASIAENLVREDIPLPPFQMESETNAENLRRSSRSRSPGRRDSSKQEQSLISQLARPPLPQQPLPPARAAPATPSQTRPPLPQTRPPLPQTRPPLPQTRPPLPQTGPPPPQTRSLPTPPPAPAPAPQPPAPPPVPWIPRTP